ncbi:MAG: hypothetical protein EP307_11280 [Rhodobacteraceae bacterium]|nr:MAG: hypothetical protein EP307_11280 [Paracoccaceae bacterium]
MRPGTAGMSAFAKAVLGACPRAFRDPEAIRASREDHRAAAGIDIAPDDADGARRLDCPVLVLWGERAATWAHFGGPDLWRRRARDVRGQALPGDHDLAEDLPDLVAHYLIALFEGATLPV